MKEVFRIKIESFNFHQRVHTCHSDNLDKYPTHDEIKKFIEDYKLKFGQIRVESQVIKIFLLDN